MGVGGDGQGRGAGAARAGDSHRRARDGTAAAAAAAAAAVIQRLVCRTAPTSYTRSSNVCMSSCSAFHSASHSAPRHASRSTQYMVQCTVRDARVRYVLSMWCAWCMHGACTMHARYVYIPGTRRTVRARVLLPARRRRCRAPTGQRATRPLARVALAVRWRGQAALPRR